MDPSWEKLAALGSASLAPIVLRLRTGLTGTSLAGAWAWAAFAWLALAAASVASAVGQLSGGTADLAWYGVAVALLVPPVAVLGARRPIRRVWTWFVLVPLVAVFGWPALAAAGRGPSAVWVLEEPLVVGFGLVLLMGAGNYVGSRHTLSALLWMLGLLWIVLPLCPGTAAFAPRAAAGRAWGTLCIAAAGWIGLWQTARRRAAPGNEAPLQRVWRDFRDTFGIVWSRRVQERFNEEARRTKLPVRLAMHGFEPAADDARAVPASDAAATTAAAEAALRWLLQKFVEPEWIDRRLGRSPSHAANLSSQ